MARKPYYGLIGNGETCALVSPKGSLEWLCLPKFDGKVIFSRALDPFQGKSLDIKIFENGKELILQSSMQRYISKSAVLETTCVIEGLTLLITDFMPFNQDAVFKSNQNTIFRIITLKNTGSKTRTVEIKVISGNKETGSDSVVNLNNIFLGFVFYNSQKLEVQPQKEATIPIAIAYGSKQDVSKSIRLLKGTNPHKELQYCIGFWINWFDRGRNIWFDDQDYMNAYQNSLMTIKLLIYQKTGAMLAAPTASFPATPGGIENWDYRYSWIRDCYFAMRALLISGHYEEVRKMLDFFYRLQNTDGHWRSPVYTIDENELQDEIIIKKLKGPEKEHIRIGNAASKQLQLDSEGSILNATYLYYIFTLDEDFLAGKWQKIRKAANWISGNYARKESGLWESRSKLEHFVYGKVMCYAGLESASKIAAVLGKKDEWKTSKEKIKDYILKNAWSEQRQAFLQTFEKDASADISVLALEDHGLIKPDSPRIKKTVKLIEQKLVRDNAVMRYEDASLPFYLPTLWLASHYIKEGNRTRAEKLIKTCVDSATDLYLVAEHFDPQSKIQYGNFPQALNAAMLVEQLLNMKKSKGLPNLFDINLTELKKLVFFDKRRLMEETEKLMGLNDTK